MLNIPRDDAVTGVLYVVSHEKAAGEQNSSAQKKPVLWDLRPQGQMTHTRDGGNLVAPTADLLSISSDFRDVMLKGHRDRHVIFLLSKFYRVLNKIIGIP